MFLTQKRNIKIDNTSVALSVYYVIYLNELVVVTLAPWQNVTFLLMTLGTQGTGSHALGRN